jgi:predicted small secreted protein
MLKIPKGGEFMDRRSWKVLAIFVLLSFLLSGCYYSGAKKEIANAEKLLSELKGAGGDKLVPYEYTSAEKFLEISKWEFNQNDFKPAKELASRSKSAGEAGLAEIQKKK